MGFNNMNTGDWIQLAAFIGAIIGLFLNYLQLRANNRQKAAEYIINLNNSFAQDPDLKEVYYQIEYAKFNYDENFHDSDIEPKLDKLLDYFESIAKLYLLSNFKLKDLEYIAYNYLVVYQDSSVQAYIKKLDSWYARRGMKVKPFADFRKVGNLLQANFMRWDGFVPIDDVKLPHLEIRKKHTIESQKKYLEELKQRDTD